jgi:ribose-phosphate pyrophosphokinase
MLYLNSEPVNVTMFPDNTSQVWNIDIPQESLVFIEWVFDTEGEFLHLAQLKDLLSTMDKTVILQLPYLPYGRQDKNISNISTFALRSFASLLNSLQFKEIWITDPHSDVALELINNSSWNYPKRTIQKILKMTDTKLVCYPDKGAVKKYTQVYDYEYIYGDKVRDQASGIITNYELSCTELPSKRILIVDDICDGGMTFKLLAEKLISMGAEEVNLFTSTGIYSKGLQTLKQSGINRIFNQHGEITEYKNNITYRKL